MVRLRNTSKFAFPPHLARTCTQHRLLMLVVMMIFPLVACIVPGVTPMVVVTATNTLQHLTTETPSAKVENPDALGPNGFPLGINPLTGQVVADPANLN